MSSEAVSPEKVLEWLGNPDFDIVSQGFFLFFFWNLKLSTYLFHTTFSFLRSQVCLLIVVILMKSSRQRKKNLLLFL
jgi:hypothetical protein